LHPPNSSSSIYQHIIAGTYQLSAYQHIIAGMA